MAELSVSVWVITLAVAIAVEAPIVVVLARNAEPNAVRVLVLVLVANVATQLAAVVLLGLVFKSISWTYGFIVQALVIAAEAMFYAITLRGIGLRRALGVSTAANLASYFVGNVLMAALVFLLG